MFSSKTNFVFGKIFLGILHFKIFVFRQRNVLCSKLSFISESLASELHRENPPEHSTMGRALRQFQVDPIIREKLERKNQMDAQRHNSAKCQGNANSEPVVMSDGAINTPHDSREQLMKLTLKKPCEDGLSTKRDSEAKAAKATRTPEKEVKKFKPLLTSHPKVVASWLRAQGKKNTRVDNL